MEVGIVRIGLMQILTDLKSAGLIILITIQNAHQPYHRFRAGIKSVV